VLHQAWKEKVKPVLVLNKIDKLILDLQLTPDEARLHISRVLERVNAIIATLFNRTMSESQEQRMKELEAQQQQQQQQRHTSSATRYRARGAQKDNNGKIVLSFDDWTEDVDDSALYFSPERGNVVFASAHDGWGFRTDDFAEIYSSKLKIKRKILATKIWGEYYFDRKYVLLLLLP